MKSDYVPRLYVVSHNRLTGFIEQEPVWNEGDVYLFLSEIELIEVFG